MLTLEASVFFHQSQHLLLEIVKIRHGLIVSVHTLTVTERC